MSHSIEATTRSAQSRFFDLAQFNIYIVEGEVLRILTEAVLQNIEPFGFYEGFAKTSPK
jgi:hypothetical protein